MLSSLQNERDKSINNREIRDYQEEIHGSNISFAATPTTCTDFISDSKDSSIDEYLKSITPQPNSWSNSVRTRDENQNTSTNIANKGIDNSTSDTNILSNIMGYSHGNKKLSFSALDLSTRNLQVDREHDVRQVYNSISDSDNSESAYQDVPTDNRDGNMSSDDDNVMESNRNVTRRKIQQLTAKFSA